MQRSFYRHICSNGQKKQFFYHKNSNAKLQHFSLKTATTAIFGLNLFQAKFLFEVLFLKISIAPPQQQKI
jgi:hypothetical protein